MKILKNFHHGGTEITEKTFGLTKIKIFSLRVLRVSVVKLFLPLFLVFPFLQGCSLLFVAKGGTHYLEKENGKAPEATSLSRQMGAPVVLRYKVREGDTLDSIADKYYGQSSKKSKIAQANQLDSQKKPKKGLVLKIPDPVLFPPPEKDEEKKDKPEGKKPKVSPTVTPVRTPGTPTPVKTPTPKPTPIKIDKVSRPKVNRAFGPGEKLKFEIRALGVLGGYASLEVGPYTTVESRPCTPLTARANGVFPLQAIYPVNDVQTSYLDAVDFVSWKFENDVHEGGYSARNREVYDQIKHKVARKHNDEEVLVMDVAPFSQDIISCFYYYRLLPLEEGKTFAIPTQSGGKNYQLIVTVGKKEKITVPAGTFECFRVKPLIKEQTVFRNDEEIDLWITTDERHIPVKIKSGIVIGSIDVDLLEATLPSLKN